MFQCHWIQGLQGNLPGRIFILSGSKALQASRVQFPMFPSILPILELHSMWQRCPAGPCRAPPVVEDYIEIGFQGF